METEVFYSVSEIDLTDDEYDDYVSACTKYFEWQRRIEKVHNEFSKPKNEGLLTQADIDALAQRKANQSGSISLPNGWDMNIPRGLVVPVDNRSLSEKISELREFENDSVRRLIKNELRVDINKNDKSEICVKLYLGDEEISSSTI